MLMIAPSMTWAATTSGSKTTKKVVKKTVTIETSRGTVKKTVTSGNTIILPGDVNGNGYTFMGWSTIKNQQCNPMYQLRSTLQKQCGSRLFDKVGFVCKSGEGLSWMKNEGEKLLLQEINKEDDSTRPIAVIFNLGVNDLIHRNGNGISYDTVSTEYASYMNGLSRKLTTRNCELFYMSVNPCNTAMKPTRKESEIRGFNNRLKKTLNGNFTWINSYSYLMRCGYTSKCEFRNYTDDGLHYSMRTYKRIYAYAIKKIRES